jgi:hypothetical protein
VRLVLDSNSTSTMRPRRSWRPFIDSRWPSISVSYAWRRTYARICSSVVGAPVVPCSEQLGTMRTCAGETVIVAVKHVGFSPAHPSRLTIQWLIRRHACIILYIYHLWLHFRHIDYACSNPREKIISYTCVRGLCYLWLFGHNEVSLFI